MVKRTLGSSRNPLTVGPAWTGNPVGFHTARQLPNSANRPDRAIQVAHRSTRLPSPQTPVADRPISGFGSSRICNNCAIPSIVTTTVVTRVSGALFKLCHHPEPGTVALTRHPDTGHTYPPTTTGAPLPPSFGNLGPGESATRVTIPGANHPPGVNRLLQLRGTYTAARLHCARSV